ncbi:YcbK family protein [Mannheimia sp. AT1]|uniref:Murein endopeptidase K n=1 Tax=Mannheimia cairinae TaxID=3025936 RepID=A0ABT5MQT3_9PAST|nr:YcbK family protein [Mannheimia cairinae]MDD0823208.1 YcbK family protein [Mannheimia cairinae]MDD0825766.1 YcbK family protein [Mannheimia cairinae]
MKQIDVQRRKWLSLGGLVLGASLLPGKVMAALSTPSPIALRFRNINTGDTYTAKFGVGGLNKTDLGRLNYLMRDRHINQVKAIDPKLFVKLNQLQRRLGFRNAEILVLSGYRSPQTNARLRRRSRGVASQSYHIRGQAVDFRVSGVGLAKVKQAAESLNNGGVGYYPRSNFVHVDTGPVRTWRGA